MRYRPEIDGLRAAAVVPVVLFHLGVAGFGGGFVGVDVFFVISGFLITSILVRDLRSGDFSLANFWERRARRILPALVAVIAATFIASWFHFTPNDFRSFGDSALAQTFFASNFVFRGQLNYFEQSAHEVPLLHTWSLAVEEQFYLLFPLSMFLLTRYVARLRWSAVAMSVVVSFVLSVWATNAAPLVAFYLLPARAWELGIGALLALWAGSHQGPGHRVVGEVASALGIGLILFAVATFDNSTPFPGTAALLPVLGTALIIWSNTGRRTSVGSLLATRPLVFVGLISYSLYLWHWPLIVFSTYPTGGESLNGQSIAIVVTASFALAYVSYRYIETPFRQRRILSRRVTIFAASAAGLIGVGCLGYIARVDVGSDFRVPGNAVAYAEVAESRSDRQRECILDGRGRLSDNLSNLCMYGTEPGDARFVVWGDSHADSLLHSLDVGADRHGLTGIHISLSACPPILDVRHVSRPLCSTHNKETLEFVETRGISTVVLVGYWVAYGGPRSRLEPLPDSGFAPEFDSHKEIVTAGVEHTARELMNAGIEVWLVRDVPTYDYDPIQRLFVAEKFGGTTREVGQEYSTYLEDQEAFDRVFSTLAQDGVNVIDLPALLCDSEWCPIDKDGIALYRDGSHLSIEGSEYVSPAFDPLFESLKSRN